MRDVVILIPFHLIVTVIRLARPGGLRSVVAEPVLVKNQLRTLNRGRKHAPNLRAAERIITGLCLRAFCAQNPLFLHETDGPFGL